MKKTTLIIAAAAIAPVLTVCAAPNGALPIIAATSAGKVHKNPLEVLSATAKPLKVRHTTERLRPGEKDEVKTYEIYNKHPKRIRIDFPQVRGNRKPAALIWFDTAKLKNNDYKFFTITYRSKSQRRIQLRIMEKSNKMGLLYSFDLGKSKGSPITLRLNLDTDFRKMNGKSFPLSDARGEIHLLDDAEIKQGVLREAVSFDILGIRFE